MGANGISLQANQRMVQGHARTSEFGVQKTQYMGKQRANRHLLDYQQRIDKKALEQLHKTSRKDQIIEYLISAGFALGTIIIVLGLWMFL